jgi:predicted metalloprotease with PDZ domain
MSFTVMSENILDEPYASNYYNVYQKGALIGMCVDILMREASNGNRGILSLMKELSNKYGKNKPFEDDKLINEIVSMTYPSLGEFFSTHVIGTTPIDYKKFFNKVGVEIVEGIVETNFIQNAGALIVGANREKGFIHFNDLVKENSFWNENGVLPNDIIRSIDGTEVSLLNANHIFGQVFSWQPGKEVNVILEREGQEIVINTTLTQSFTMGKSLKEKENATEAQRVLRKAWLKG